MIDPLLSSARFMSYLRLEELGILDVAGLASLNQRISADLWLPISLIEVGYRNHCDRVLRTAVGDDWLFGVPVGAGTVLKAEVIGAPRIVESTSRTADAATQSPERSDPVAAAAARIDSSSPVVTRDDVIAHLMLGFWVVTVPRVRFVEGVDVTSLLIQGFGEPLTSKARAKRAFDRLLRQRNRIAHHEPILVRRKAVFSPAGTPLPANVTLNNLIGACERLHALAADLQALAEIFAPFATSDVRLRIRAVEEEVRRFEEVLRTAQGS